MKLDYPFIKSVSLNDLPESAWKYFVGGEEGGTKLQDYYRSIPFLFRGVDIRANAVCSVPFAIYKGKQEIDTSADYQNKVGALPHPRAIIGMVEAALTIFGYAYAKKDKNLFGLQAGLRYWLPSSITPDIDSKTGAITFERMVGGQPFTYTPEEIVYWWKPDPYVEIGPPSSSPAKAAAAAAGVLFNADQFAAAFFERGAIKVTLLTTKNIQPQERSRLKTWWSRLAKGKDGAWQSDIINAEAVTPVVIGEGLESLESEKLTDSKRIDIAAALGIPYSVLFSNASNRATAEQDDLHLYTKTIIPDCDFIAEVLTTQYLEPLGGYSLVFRPEEMDIFQEDENERAASLNQIITALNTPEEFLIAANILGYELSKDVEAKIVSLIQVKREAREQMAAVTAQTQPVQEELETVPSPEDNLRAADLYKWRTKCLRRVKAGKDAAAPFDSKHISAVLRASITGSLEGAETEEQVRAIFSDPFAGYP